MTEFDRREGRSERSTLRASIGIAVSAFLIGSVFSPIKSRNPLLVGFLARPLEERFLRPTTLEQSHFTGIIALGGRSYYRVPEAGELARHYQFLTVAVSGAGSKPYVEELLGPGINPSRIIIDQSANSTRQNAIVLAGMLRPKPGSRWLLVTSAIHMPRAVAAFRAVGFDVEPWPVFDGRMDPYSIDDAFREWIGLAFYRLMGWTKELWPDRHNRAPV